MTVSFNSTGWVLAALMIAACASVPEKSDDPAQLVETDKPFVVEETESEKMTNASLEKLIKTITTKVVGSTGAWRFDYDGVLVIVMTDERADRMRIVTPVAKTESLTPELRAVLLEANFHTALDARYATSGDFVYSVYLHRLSTLDAADFKSGLRQVVTLAKTYGSTFTSGEMQFN